MRLGLALPHYDFSVPGERPLRWDTIRSTAVAAEAAGADSLWLSDHLILDVEKYGGGPGTYFAYEPLVTLAALAASVPRVRLGTLVLCEALRHPAVLAHALASLDRIAGGRIDVGLGAGWYEPEYELIGTTMPRPGERLDRLSEAIEIVTRMLDGEALDFAGVHYTVRGAEAKPPPVQRPRPPVFLGGKGDRLLRLVAERADGWNTVWTWTPDAYRERLGALERACDAAGRDPASVWRTLGLYALVGEDRADLERRYRRLQHGAPGGMLDGVPLDAYRAGGRLVGTVDEVREQASEWAALGVETLILCVGPLPFSVSDPDDVALALGTLAGERRPVVGD